MAPRIGTSGAPPARTKVPAPGATSSVGIKPPALKAPKPRPLPNTRDYGKKAPAPLPQPQPFGPPDSPGVF